MKIQNDGSTYAPQVTGEKGVSRVPPKDTTVNESGAPACQTADSAETSAIAQALDADPVRLDRLREAVQSGTYNVSAGEIAARLIHEHLNKPR